MKIERIGSLELWGERQKRLARLFGHNLDPEFRLLVWKVTGYWTRLVKDFPYLSAESRILQLRRIEMRFLHAPAEIQYSLLPEDESTSVDIEPSPIVIEDHHTKWLFPDFATAA
ncbi:MAG: hypothetical protein WCO09_02280 [bacterium]